MKLWEQPFTVKFNQVDMAGISYFNEAFNIFHGLYEDWILNLVDSKMTWFSHPEWAVPIKNVQAEYSKPLLAFESYTGRIAVEKVGGSSFVLKTQLMKGDVTCCEITSTHVFMDKKTFKARAMPEDVKARLEKLI